MSGGVPGFPTNIGTCSPAFIVFRRENTGTYIPYTFGNILELGRWAIDTAFTAPPTVTAASAAVSAPVDWKAAVEEVIKLPFKDATFIADTSIDSARVVTLTPIEVKIIINLFKSYPQILAEKLFYGLTSTHMDHLASPEFMLVCEEKDMLISLEDRLTAYKTYSCNEFISVIKGLHKFLTDGIHHMSWESHWITLRFEDVETWSLETAPVILEECLRSWLTSEKPSDIVRDFFIQTHLVQNYKRIEAKDNIGRFLSESTEVSSSDFLKGLTDAMNQSPTACGIPSAIAMWVAKGVSYTHCKHALAKLGIEQVRKASGQFYKNLSPEPYYTGKELFNIVPSDKINHFRMFHDKAKMLDSVMDDSLNTFDAPPAQTKDTNPLLTVDFKELLKKKEDGDYLSVYKQLLTILDKEKLEFATKKRNSPVTLPSSKETSTPLEAVWTPTAETHITLVE